MMVQLIIMVGDNISLCKAHLFRIALPVFSAFSVALGPIIEQTEVAL